MIFEWFSFFFMPSHTGEHSVYVALLYNVSNILVPWRCVHTSRKRREKLKLLCLGVKFMTLSARSDFKPSSTRGSSRGSTCLWCSRPINRKLLIRPRTNPVFEHFENQIVYGWRRPHRDENCTLASHSWVYFCFVIVTCVSRQTRERKKKWRWYDAAHYAFLFTRRGAISSPHEFSTKRNKV